MKQIIFTLLLAGLSQVLQAQEWKPAGERIKTAFGEKLDPANLFPEYPRPQLMRDQWQNLDGLWDYTIAPKGNGQPAAFNGKILVPFALESSLSGVQKKLGAGNELW